MKISRRRLKQIIKEELSAVMEDEQLELPIHQEGKKELLQAALHIFNTYKGEMVSKEGMLQTDDVPEGYSDYFDDEVRAKYSAAVKAFEDLHTEIYGEYESGDLEDIAKALARAGAYRYKG